jgi:hypothetical protein
MNSRKAREGAIRLDITVNPDEYPTLFLWLSSLGARRRTHWCRQALSRAVEEMLTPDRAEPAQQEPPVIDIASAPPLRRERTEPSRDGDGDVPDAAEWLLENFGDTKIEI